MRVSIITIVYNNAVTVADAIQSVLNQDYQDIEYIIIDGKSTDGTVEVIEKFGRLVDMFISEPDGGLYDAINKGIHLATGDIIGLLHSDDIFANDHVISDIVKTFESRQVDSVYGDLDYVDRGNMNNIVRKWKSGSYDRNNFIYGWMPPHPTFYAKKSCFDKYGSYDLTFGSAADYELMLRFLFKFDISTAYLSDVLVKMRVGGKSNATLKNRIMANSQDYRAWLKNGLKPKFYTRILKPLHKIPQYFTT